MTTEESDLVLVKRVQRGDKSAFDLLVQELIIARPFDCAKHADRHREFRAVEPACDQRTPWRHAMMRG